MEVENKKKWMPNFTRIKGLTILLCENIIMEDFSSEGL